MDFDPNRKLLQLDICIDRCVAEVYLNGIPLGRASTITRSVASISCLLHVVEGENLLELLINPGATPSRARENVQIVEAPTRKNERGFAQAMIMRYLADSFVGDGSGELIAKVALDAPKDARAGSQLVKTTFRIESKDEPTLKRWAWQDAEVIDLVADREAIDQVVRVAWNGFKTGVFSDEFDQLTRMVSSEICHAIGMERTDEENREMADLEFRERAAQYGWKVASLDKSMMDFRLCAEGRLVQIINRDWRRTVRSVPIEAADGSDDTEEDFPMLLGKLNGKFHILRYD